MAKDPFTKFTKYKGYLNERTYEEIWNGTTVLPNAPFKPLDCWLVVMPLQERTNIPGFVFAGTPEYSKDREIDCVVLASGPGYRVRGGSYPYHFDGQRVLNETKRGDIVHFLERAGNPFIHKDRLYYTIEEHKVYFAVDSDDQSATSN